MSEPSPGFRIGPDDLTNAEALAAMRQVAAEMVRSALTMRVTLLSHGFSDDHSLCRELDATARQYATDGEVLLRMSAALTPDDIEAVSE